MSEIKTTSLVLQPNQERMDTFFRVYARHLAANGVVHTDAVYANLKDAWLRGCALKDGQSCRATIRELSIKDTYQAIYAYLAGDDESCWRRGKR